MYFRRKNHYPAEPMGATFPHAKLAEAWVPYQTMGMIYEPPMGLQHGTIFPELVRPYEPHKAKWY